jgi:hypothetical protein
MQSAASQRAAPDQAAAPPPVEGVEAQLLQAQLPPTDAIADAVAVAAPSSEGGLGRVVDRSIGRPAWDMLSEDPSVAGGGWDGVGEEAEDAGGEDGCSAGQGSDSGVRAVQCRSGHGPSHTRMKGRMAAPSVRMTRPTSSPPLEEPSDHARA